MQRPGLAILGWTAATLVAVAVAYGGVSAVAGRVVDPLPPTLGLPSAPEPTETTTAPASSPTSATTTPPPTDVEPTAEPTTTSTAATRSYTLVGGSATLRFEPGRVTVVTAAPAQGFRMDVEGEGTSELRVEFDSDAHRSRLRGWWEGGARDRIDEDVRDDDAEPDDDDDDDD